MNKKQQEEFLSKIPDSNTQWAAQTMLLNLKPKERYQIIWALRKLNKVLYKSWAKELSLKELMEAIEMMNPPKEGTGALAD